MLAGLFFISFVGCRFFVIEARTSGSANIRFNSTWQEANDEVIPLELNFQTK